MRATGQYLLLRAEWGQAKGHSVSCMWRLSGLLQNIQYHDEERSNEFPLTRGCSASQVGKELRNQENGDLVPLDSGVWVSLLKRKDIKVGRERLILG